MDKFEAVSGALVITAFFLATLIGMWLMKKSDAQVANVLFLVFLGAFVALWPTVGYSWASTLNDVAWMDAARPFIMPMMYVGICIIAFAVVLGLYGMRRSLRRQPSTYAR